MLCWGSYGPAPCSQYLIFCVIYNLYTYRHNSIINLYKTIYIVYPYHVSPITHCARRTLKPHRPAP